MTESRPTNPGLASSPELETAESDAQAVVSAASKHGVRNRPSHVFLVFLLALIGSLALLQVRWNSILHDNSWIVAAEISIYVIGGWLVRWRGGSKPGQQTKVLVALFYFLGPCISFVVLRLLDMGESFESLLMLLCHNSAFFLIAVGRTRAAEQLSVLFSFFLVFFVSALSETPGVFLLTIPYILLGTWWLVVSHWTRLEMHMPAKIERNMRLRTFSLAVSSLLVLAVVFLVGWNHEPIMHTINGFMPTSGGQRYSDRYARSGVGDGDFFVAARNQASTVGPVESELFLESTRPSLFDIIEENYNRPALKKKKKSERAFSPDDVTLKRSEEKIVQSEQSGRTFRVSRRPSEEKIKVTENRSNALFYLVGPTPIRLALNYFDHFDGLDWSVSKQVAGLPQRRLVGQEIDDQYWVQFEQQRKPISRDLEGSRQPQHPYYQGYETHSVKIIRLSSNRILSPSSLAGWHFDKCDSTSFFDWTDDGAIQFVGRDSLPELAIYHVISRGVNYRKLGSAGRKFSSRSQSPYSQLADLDSQDQLSSLAQEVTSKAENDWERVAAVLEFLRSKFELVPHQLATTDSFPGGQTDLQPISEFLEARSGPDYMFATVAALMLRTMGMETRVVQGFFVGTDDFDAYSNESIVHADCLHFWVEVRVDGRDWITIEPSPGYPMPRTKTTLWQNFTASILSVTTWVINNPLTSGGVLLGGFLVWWLRESIVQVVFWFLWLIEGLGSSRRRVVATLRLMQRRCWLAGKPYHYQSISELCKPYLPVGVKPDPGTRQQIKLLDGAFNRLLYRSRSGLAGDKELLIACWRIARQTPDWGSLPVHG